MNKKPFLKKAFSEKLKKPFLGKSLGKKGIAGDALIIILSLIIIATLGAISISLFAFDALGTNVKQVIQEKEYAGELGEIFFNFLKQDADYFELNNLDLIILFLDKKLDYEFVNNRFSKILNKEGCWVLELSNENLKTKEDLAKKETVIVDFRESAANPMKPACTKLQFLVWGKIITANLPYKEEKVEARFAIVK